MNTYIKRMLIKAAQQERNWIDEYAADPEKVIDAAKEEVPAAGFESYPSVSVQQGEAVFVEFLGEPEPKTTKDKKEVAYANVILLAPTDGGWDSAAKEQVSLKEGARSAINLKRHVGLWRGAQAHAPLTGKRFMIANMKDKVKTRKGSACDYRFVVLG